MKNATIFKYIALGSMTAALLPATGCGKKEEAKETTATIADRVMNVKVVTAEKAAFERHFAVTGSLTAEDFASVAARTSGNVDAVSADIGDAVEGGKTTLFQIDPVELQNRVTIAEMAVATSEASLEVAKANLLQAAAERDKAVLDAERYARLHEQKKVSDNEFEQMATQRKVADAAVAIAEANINLAKQQIEQNKASLAIAKRNLEDATGVAPLSGTVSARLKEPGERVAPGDVIFRISNLNRIRAAAYLPAEYYGEVVPGKTVFNLTVNGKDLGAHKVTVKSPEIDKKLRVFEFRGLLENVPEAVPGAFAKFSVVFETREGISVPDVAVLDRGEGKVLYVEENGVAREVHVTVGLRNNGMTEIVDGLKGGERVVVEGQSQLYEGRKVNVVD